jgi:hypothetical protein
MKNRSPISPRLQQPRPKAQVLNLDELSWFITLVSGEEFLPICHRKIAALKENPLLPDAGSRLRRLNHSGFLILIANTIMSYMGGFDRTKYYILVIICVQIDDCLFASMRSLLAAVTRQSERSWRSGLQKFKSAGGGDPLPSMPAR